jgi:hypothetical protein
MITFHPLLEHLQTTTSFPKASPHPSQGGQLQRQTDSTGLTDELKVSATRTLFRELDESHVTVALSVGNNARKLLVARLVWALRTYTGINCNTKSSHADLSKGVPNSSQSNVRQPRPLSNAAMSARALQCLLRVGMHSYESAIDIACVAGLVDMLVEYYVLNLLTTFAGAPEQKGNISSAYECASFAIQMLRLLCCVDKTIAMRLKEQVCKQQFAI